MQNSIAIDGKGRPEKWAWPGGYPIFYLVQEEGNARGAIAEFCAACIPKHLGTDDVVIAAEINWEDPALYCESCGGRVESAYAEDDVPKE